MCIKYSSSCEVKPTSHIRRPFFILSVGLSSILMFDLVQILIIYETIAGQLQPLKQQCNKESYFKIWIFKVTSNSICLIVQRGKSRKTSNQDLKYLNICVVLRTSYRRTAVGAQNNIRYSRLNFENKEKQAPSVNNKQEIIGTVHLPQIVQNKSSVPLYVQPQRERIPVTFPSPWCCCWTR